VNDSSAPGCSLFLTDRLSKTKSFAFHYNYFWNMERSSRSDLSGQDGKSACRQACSIWPKNKLYFQMKKSKVLLLIPFLICSLSFGVFAQDKWDLRRCVEYALTNNLSVQQTSVDAQIAAVNEQERKWSKYPNADFSTNTGLQWDERSIFQK
jgi:outer membrane protein